MSKKLTSRDLLEQTKDPEYEREFKQKHQRLSLMSSAFFALAGATFIGVLGALSAKILGAAEQGNPLFKKEAGKPTPVFHNKKFMSTAGAMAGIGGVFMYLSNKLETQKTMYEDRRLVHLLDKSEEKREELRSGAPEPQEVGQESNRWQERAQRMSQTAGLTR